jgi:NAD+ synthase (glutamine-hydrolysing)
MFDGFTRNSLDEAVCRAARVDATEENIQSRCRGILLMAISNKTGFGWCWRRATRARWR